MCSTRSPRGDDPGGIDELVRQARAAGVDLGSSGCLLAVGHEGRLSDLLTELTGTRSRPLRHGEAVCVRGDSLQELAAGHGAVHYRCPVAEHEEEALRAKVQSKMTVATLLAGFVFTALSAVLVLEHPGGWPGERVVTLVTPSAALTSFRGRAGPRSIPAQLDHHARLGPWAPAAYSASRPALRPANDTTVTGEPTPPWTPADPAVARARATSGQRIGPLVEGQQLPQPGRPLSTEDHFGIEVDGVNLLDELPASATRRQHRLGTGAEGAGLAADLVVDASGRQSPLAGWLEALGTAAPTVEQVAVDLTYAVTFVEPPAWPLGPGITYAVSQNLPPQWPRFGLALAVEGGRWAVLVGGYHGDRPPVDPDGFRAFAASLPPRT